MNPTGQQLARTSRILRFLVKYRHSGMFTGWDLRVPLDVAIETGSADHRPDQFVDDLEALGPTFVKLGQALSTRPDLVPPAYLTALTRMQSQVTQTPLARDQGAARKCARGIGRSAIRELRHRAAGFGLAGAGASRPIA